MSDFNTFTGKTVDDAISEACRFFGTERDRLVVEIITGGSTGIFGLVGKKKAQIRARRRQDPAVAAMLAEEERKGQAELAKSQDMPSGQPGEPAVEVSVEGPGAPADQPRETPVRPAQGKPEEQGRQRGRNGGDGQNGQNGRERSQKHRDGRQGKPQQPRQERPKRAEAGEARADAERRTAREADNGRRARADAAPGAEFSEDDLADARDGADVQDQTPASPELLALAGEIMERLIVPILGETPRMEIEGTAGRVNVIIDDEEHSGLLIGREGQTLAALQYLANRILARRWETPVRLQLNTGEYREKQDDNLRKMAAFLADKARSLGRPQSTKPLSSYHRRVIHMALQGDETIQTRSKGEGPMKRVIIVPKRSKGEAQPQ